MTDPVPTNPQPDVDADERKRIRLVEMAGYETSQDGSEDAQFNKVVRAPAGWRIFGGILYTEDETGKEHGRISFRFTEPPLDSNEPVQIVVS